MSERTVVFQYLDADGDPVAGYLLFTPTVVLVDSASDEFLTLEPAKVYLDATGSGSVILTCTDDPAYQPTGWAWAVSELIPGGRNNDNTYYVLLPASSTDPVGLTDLPGAVPVVFGSVGLGGGGSSGPSTHDTWYGDTLPTNGERVPPYLWVKNDGSLYLVTDGTTPPPSTTIYPSATRYPSGTSYPSDGGSTPSALYPSDALHPSSTLYPAA